jgi:hypothetical protein
MVAFASLLACHIGSWVVFLWGRNVTWTVRRTTPPPAPPPPRPLRRYYVPRLFGICYDDYDYKRVNLIMDIKLKSYVKQVQLCVVWSSLGPAPVHGCPPTAPLFSRSCSPESVQVICFPENVTFADFNSALPFLRQDEVCHVLVLAIESRRQSELLYALHALMSHVNG